MKRTILLVIASVVYLSADPVFSCSMYKVTAYGKTMVGNNFDAYFLHPKIWFERGTGGQSYGAVFIGAREEGSGGVAPQSGLNERGLTFTRQGAPPWNGIPDPRGRKPINDPNQYLKDIIHTCASVQEVRKYISQYDHSYFSQDVFMYIDSSGHYLIVEADTILAGQDPKYVLANFCPSKTDVSQVKQNRYLKGVAFLQGKMDISLAFCTALSDTMHVCREKIGDGTLMTFIRDLKSGAIYLNFYHDYSHTVRFDLKEELAKGDHVYEVSALFPPNAEFKRLVDFKTPYNTLLLMYFIYFCMGLFLFSFLFFLVGSFIRRKSGSYVSREYSWLRLVLCILSLCLLYYMIALMRDEGIFYFPAPYKDYVFTLVNLASYLPVIMLVFIGPLLYAGYRIMKERVWRRFSRWLFLVNNVTYVVLLVLFGYWGFFNIF